MKSTDPGDGAWLHERLRDALPEPRTSADRMVRLHAGRQQARRRRNGGAAVVAIVTVSGISLASTAVLGHGADQPKPPADQTPVTTAPAVVAPVLECPRIRDTEGDSGPSTLAMGATSARLCVGDEQGAPTPRDVLTSGLDELVDSVNTQPRAALRDCGGPMGDRFLLMLAYPDGNERQVSLNFSACGSIEVGGATRANPAEPFRTFMDLLRQQRRTAPVPTQVPAPTCLPPYSSSAVAPPGEMMAARLCVTYNDNGNTTSVAVPDSDLSLILDAWRNGQRSPLSKGPGCGPTTPTWVLSGVTQWGDPVAITAECGHPSHGEDLVEMTPQAQAVIDELVSRAGVHVDDGTSAPTAWMLANTWLEAVNARATVSSGETAAHIARIANSMWVTDPWLPDGQLDWDLLGASRTEAAGWQQAWQVPARTPQGQAVFVVVRDRNDDHWRILTLTR